MNHRFQVSVKQINVEKEDVLGKVNKPIIRLQTPLLRARYPAQSEPHAKLYGVMKGVSVSFMIQRLVSFLKYLSRIEDCDWDNVIFLHLLSRN